MIEFLNSSAGVALSSIATVVGLLFAFIAYLKPRSEKKRKAITWELVSDLIVLNVSSAVKQRVKILLDNKPVSDLCLVILEIRNSGDVVIQPADFINQRPISFTFDGAEVLDAEVLNTTREGLTDDARAILKRDAKHVKLGPLVLNTKDWITLKVLLTKHLSGKVSADININGINKIVVRTSVWETSKKSLILCGVVLGLGGLAVGYCLQWYVFPLLAHNLIILTITAFVSLFLKSFIGSVGISIYSILRGRFKTVKSVLIFWSILSTINALPIVLFVALISK